MSGPEVSAGHEKNPDLEPELSVRVMSMVLLYFQRHYGRDRLEALWKRDGYSLPLAYFEDLSHFVSLRFVERLTVALAAESGDPEFVRKAAEQFATPEAMGFMYYLLRAVGTPKVVFHKIFELGPTFNRAGGFVIEHETATEMRVAYTSRVAENNRNFCVGRQVQLASLPTIWKLPPAQIVETECQAQGGRCCRYELRWQNPQTVWRKVVGAALAVLLGWVAVRTGHGSPAVIIPLALVGGWALSGWYDLRREVASSRELLADQNRGLVQSLQELQKRNDEMRALNLELESRVESRTRDLSASNASLEQALARARELDRLKTEFFDNVSHELRTPLSLILLSLDSLAGRDGSTPAGDLRVHLDAVERSASRLLRLINQLLDVAKLEAGKMRLRYEPVELHGFLTSLLIPFRQLATRQQVSLELHGAPVEAVQVDAEKVDVVFQNLLSNALKFTSAGGKVLVRVTELPEAVQIEVQDTGVGIPADDLPVIFDRFAQADSQGIKRFGGTGIGLALVKETVEIHGGRISVASKVGEGTTFTVTFPRGTAHVREELRERRGGNLPVPRERRVADSEPLLTVKPRPGSGAHVALPAPPPMVDGPKILVVEDDPDLRRVIVGALRTRYRVLEAGDGEEGLERARKELPELVVSDLMMPRRSGLQLLQALRQEAATAAIPFILLTARRETDAVVDGLSEGANDYLGKPFVARELLARVEVQLRLKEAAERSATAERLSALGLLTTGFAHEVRNPLNGLLNAVEPLRGCLGDPGARLDAEQLLDVMRDCGQRVQSLSESLLGFARSSPSDQPVDVAASVLATVKVLGTRVTDGVKVVTRLRDNPRVLGDRSALSQVWLNLLDNALRAMGEHGTLTLGTERVGDQLEVRITDTGPGMSGEVQAQIFQPFFSTRAAGEGTGLGLALCKRIVLAHRGSIRVTSAPGQGTTFIVALPIDPATVMPAPGASDLRAS